MNTEFKNMTKQEIVLEALGRFGTSNNKQLSAFIKRKFNVDISPSSVSGTLRTLVAQGLVGKSNCGAGCTMYWLNSPAWKEKDDND